MAGLVDIDIGVMVVTDVVRCRPALAPAFQRLLEQIDAMAGVAATLRAALRAGRRLIVVVDRDGAAAWVDSARWSALNDAVDGVRLVLEPEEPERIVSAAPDRHAFSAFAASHCGRQDVVIVCTERGTAGVGLNTIHHIAACRAVTILVGGIGLRGLAASVDLDIQIAVDGPGQFGPISATLVDLLLGVAMADAGLASISTGRTG